jgi:3-oxoacyl-[acyl-carrier protein] reductase
VDLGLSGRGCAVTGASRGIGREVARMLCAEGADVLLVARSDDRLADAARECAREEGNVDRLAIDVTGEDSGERIVAEAVERFGQLDVLVNNAGTARWRDLDDVPEQDWRDAFELNVMAPLRTMRAAAPPMAERGWGRIVNVSSTAGKRPSATMPEYSVAKAAELSLSRLFADRYAKRGVLVNAICPGPIAGELWMEPGGLLDQSMELGGHRQPRGGTPDRRLEAADRASGRGEGDRGGDRLSMLGARLLRQRRRLVGGRGHRAGDHLARSRSIAVRARAKAARSPKS